MLEKNFDPKSAEPRLYAQWEESGLFAPRGDAAETYSIVIPPPNVTGSLHIGHALNNTLQDVLARYHRMRGKAVLWLPGTDHAGIATQMVVERQLAAAGNVGRRDMGREAFVETVWKWKAESGGTIVRQLRRLGASCDWSRERFTLDEGLSAAVRKVFVQLHRDGLIYRDKRLVNWDPHFQTAISDLEVEQKEVDGAYWHFAYPLADGVTYEHPIAFDDDGKAVEWETRDHIVVATTRPETMLGDTGVAVHPDDDRYAGLVGKSVILPITGRRIPIVADDYADPTKGSGAVKITPAHDFNDFGVGKRAGLAALNVMDGFGRITAADTPDVPSAYEGMDRFAARKVIVARAEEEGWLKLIEKTRHMVPHGDRSGVVIEPWLTDQWYVDAKVLAQPALKAVEDGDTVFEPKSYEKIYFEWLRNIEPWCISRQLWWGHRIPAWYGPNGEIFVAETEEEARAQAGDLPLTQDEDVLDTWFSSALWPFSTMGWPEKTSDLERFYPTSDLVTAADIIFFWVARMMMMGLHFTGEAPFRRVIINGLVRDEKGQKMSKSKGNVIDPLEIVDEVGADALRFTMAILSGTRDIKLSKQRIEGYRNFGTKLWNAARFSQMNDCARVAGFDPAGVTSTLNLWIRGELTNAERQVSAALEAGRFDEAAQALYRFVWNVFCDWYLELAKPVFQGVDEAAKAETRAMTAWTLDQTIKLLAPVMPFITEELWAELGKAGAPRDEGMLLGAAWPDLPDAFVDAEAEAEIGWLIEVVEAIRALKGEMSVATTKPPLTFLSPDAATTARLERHRDLLAGLARVSDVATADQAPAGAVAFVAGGGAAALTLAGLVDVAAERARLDKEIKGIEADVALFSKKLDNPNFVARAAPEVVQEQRDKLAAAEADRARLEAARERLAALG
ncbi:MAG: valine--tRNA ligase [Alphaproteobacteria bacterium]|nr:valine--tRNA ligase [Alphaproteobacteria bacterium]MBU1525689.1 valine--tRNA ligase [Alphaproteobacteria bacterium]MBU2116608.1 valine--tRNA ligase [Alphaproteobacteria bacterium]MBU2351930.1 valine--tRNA ligase [Alphaproteobacteria bacterium]MBU2383707.1 valine--tRNA ligase [Alphaproteobacteria bacterium]